MRRLRSWGNRIIRKRGLVVHSAEGTRLTRMAHLPREQRMDAIRALIRSAK